jgi:hypothetical protein
MLVASLSATKGARYSPAVKERGVLAQHLVFHRDAVDRDTRREELRRAATGLRIRIGGRVHHALDACRADCRRAWRGFSMMPAGLEAHHHRGTLRVRTGRTEGDDLGMRSSELRMESFPEESRRP